MAESDNKILVTGAAGQLGVELTTVLRHQHGSENVIATDIRNIAATNERSGVSGKPGSMDHAASGPPTGMHDGPFELMDVLDSAQLTDVVQRHRIGTIYHLAAILSANGEKQIEATWRLNIDGLLNVLELARNRQIERIFWPSSIAVFGPDAPPEQTPQNAPLNPVTVYGISKMAGEQWCAYYHRRFGVDVRSLRYPGLIGWKSAPGGGTTDYAVEMLHAAAEGSRFESPIDRNTRLPMMFMDDAVKAVIDLMAAKPEQVITRTSYNVTAMSFTPEELASVIREYDAGFEISYAPDEREQIAKSWPDSIDDQNARTDWNWDPEYDLRAMVRRFTQSRGGKFKSLL